jgi:hypothetical protein
MPEQRVSDKVTNVPLYLLLHGPLKVWEPASHVAFVDFMKPILDVIKRCITEGLC